MLLCSCTENYIILLYMLRHRYKGKVCARIFDKGQMYKISDNLVRMVYLIGILFRVYLRLLLKVLYTVLDSIEIGKRKR